MLHMEQKDYISEVVLELLRKKNYARGIAKDLGTNHMIVVRKLKELLERNVVDFSEEGRNKVYFLKNSIEAKNYSIIAETYKLNKTLNKYPVLRKIAGEIIDNKKIRLAVLFGSYVKGLADKNSDIDIYIETLDKGLKKQIENINSKLSVKVGRYNNSNLLIKEIMKNHVIIKGIELYYERNKFFEKA